MLSPHNRFRPCYSYDFAAHCGAGSDFAWNLAPAIGIDAGKCATLKVGYRILSEDYTTGSGNEEFKYDVITQTMIFGMSLNFQGHPKFVDVDVHVHINESL